MSGPSPTQMERARRLLAHELALSGTTESAVAASQVYEQLHAHLDPLLGTAGVQALFARSAKLLRGEFAHLADASALDGATKLRECLQAQDPAVALASATALFGAFFTLITLFIGERLTSQLLRRAWPTLEDVAATEPP